MKKLFALFVSLFLIFCLSSCVSVKKEVELSQDRANIISIEIYDAERLYDEEDIHIFLDENEPTTILKSEYHTDFLDTLCTLEFEKEIVLFPMPMDGGCDYYGYIIVVTYSDGGYDIIASGGLYSYSVGRDGEGRHKYDYSNYCGETPWRELVEEYIDK